MANPITIETACPRCGEPVGLNDRTCKHCGIDLALAAVMAFERTLADTPVVPVGTPIAPEVLVPRLGEILLEKHLISPENLQRALDYSQELAGRAQPRLLGQILLDLGLLDRETLDQVITEQIFQLQAALHQSNLQLEKRVQDRTVDLQNALNKLAELNQLKSNFISNISHELRTPLTHIKGYLDLLSDGSLGSLDEQQEKALGVMLRAEQRLEQLIEDLLRFSLASRGEFTLHIEEVNVREVVESVVSRMAQTARAKDVALGASFVGELPLVKADSEKVTWVVLQLLDNGIKFTPKGGRVWVEAVPDEMGVSVSVSDTGIGIPDGRIDEIFEPFHQLDGSETRRYGGTGLGLALVQRIVEAHGSMIKVDSEIDKGSRFEFSLQRVKDSYV